MTPRVWRMFKVTVQRGSTLAKSDVLEYLV